MCVCVCVCVCVCECVRACVRACVRVRACVESVPLYGSEDWTLTKSLEKQLNGCYSRLLRMVFNVHWKEHVTNEELEQ